MDVIELINIFRTYYKMYDYGEIDSESLLAKHDPTIRFTNSTSSAMKPYYTNGNKMNNKLLLIQPAMGCQGIDYWMKEKKVGCYSSYFLSFGIMGSYADYKSIIKLSLDFFTDILRINKDDFIVQYTDKHIEFANEIEKTNICRMRNQFDDEYYLHYFGIDGLLGKTMCYTIKNGDYMRYVGSVIILEQDGKPVAVEHSFDSTLLLAAIKKEGHPVLELPGIIKWNLYYEKLIPYKMRIAFFDLLYVSVVLVIEGLKPGARGRRRNLRNIIKEVSRIVCKYKIILPNLRRIVQDIVEEELSVRKNLRKYEMQEDCKKEVEFYILSIIKENIVLD